MEGGDGPSAISINPNTIKAAQEEMGRLDVLVCGQCHSVFHFIDEFQEHRSKEGACSKLSHFRENSNNEQKAQVWAFLLWKDTQIQQDSPDKDTANSWKLYQKWCKMETHVRDCWIMAGKTIQTFTKISNTKMQDAPRQQGNVTTEGSKTVVVRKVIRNGQPESPDKKEFKTEIRIKNEPSENKDKVKLKPSIKPKGKLNESGENNAETSDEEYIVEKILAKRFNPKKKVYEYLLKWEGYAHEHNTWEEVAQVSMTCKQLMDEFEKNLAKQKELKAQQVAKSISRANQLGLGQKIFKIDNVKAGPSSATQAGRPMRSSKSKAMDQVKQWCGSMKEEDNDLLGKRKIAFSDSDSDDDGLSGIGTMKRSKVETSGDDDWTADSEEDKVVIGRSDVIQRAFSRANAQSNGSNRSSGPMTGTDLTNNMIANNKGIVKIDPKQSSIQQGQSNVYIVHRKDGIIKLDSSPTNKVSVKGPTQTVGGGVLMLQNRDGVTRKQIVTGSSHANSITPVKVISKPDGTQVVTQMKVVPKGSPSKPGAVVAPKNEPIKIQPKPDPNQLQQIHLVTAIPSPLGLQSQRMTTTNVRATGQRLDGRPLLPRPSSTVRAAAPGLMSITQTRTPVRAPPPRQLAPQTIGMQQQRPLLQKRATPTSTLVQVSSPGVVPVRPKITVVNQQGKVMQKTLVSPLSKVATPGKTQSVVSPQQKMLMARRKVAEQAGVLPKLGTRTLTGVGRGGVRPRGRPSEANRPKESKLVESDGLHMEFHELESEESSSDDEPDFPPVPAEPVQPAEPDSPPRQFTLCPLTGRIIGPDGEPVDQPEPEPEPTQTTATPTPMAIVQVSGTATPSTESAVAVAVGTTPEGAEFVLPSLEALGDSPSGVVRVEMSPGGTTGTILQTSEPASVALSNVVVPGPDLPCLDDPSVEVQPTPTQVAAEPEVPVSEPSAEPTILPVVTKDEQGAVATTTSNVKMEEGGSLVTITGDDGVVYQVTGHAEDGQTLLVTRGADGEQQCVYVTTTEQQGEEGSVLTLDHAVAEAVAQLMPDQVNLAPQFYVKEATEGALEGTTGVVADNQQMVMSVMDNTNTVVATGQEDGENQAQVVAQVIQADEPTPGGTRRVVLLLPDGNLMMTEVDEEQYAALELDKKLDVTDTIAEVKKVQSEVRNFERCQMIGSDEEFREFGDSLSKKIQKSESPVTNVNSTNNSNSIISLRSQKNILKTDARRTILIARPDIIKFFNCESTKTYKKRVIVKNVDTQLARFKFESRPPKSAFDVFIESSKKGDKRNIAPGMHLRIAVYYKCDGLSEPEETLLLLVKGGKPVKIKIRTYRDCPILKVIAKVLSSPLEYAVTNSESELKNSASSQVKTFEKQRLLKNVTKSSFYKTSIDHLNIDCKKCFVGELIVVSNVFKNIGGKGRFFIMSEFDWCSMNIEDLTVKNKLIIPPFALWPSYFILHPKEQLTMFTYFYPETRGLQVNQLYIISDNCSLKTIEVVGDGVMFEPELLRLDKYKIKLQWYQTKSNELITIRYLDLGSGCYNDVLSATFTISSTCELDLRYRWTINNDFTYPTEYTNLFRRKYFCLEQINIKPNHGTFKSNSITTFQLLACLTCIRPEQYRSNLQLIIEDMPLTAVPEKCNFLYKESKSTQRFCDNPVDIFFRNIEIRIKCVTTSFANINASTSNRTGFMTENKLYNELSSTISDYPDNSFYDSNSTFEDEVSDNLDSTSDETCQFLLGNGVYKCHKYTAVNQAILRPSRPLFVGVETEFDLVLRNTSCKKLIYSWGNIFGRDRLKIEVKFQQKYNFISPKSFEIIKLTLLPLESGNISSMFVTCRFCDKSPIILSIECTIQSLSISLYFSSTYESNVPFFDKFFIDLNANEFVSKLDNKTGQINLIRGKLNAEKFIHCTILNNSSSESSNSKLNSNSTTYEYEERTLSSNNLIIPSDDGEQKKSKINNVDENGMSYDLLDNYWGGEEFYDTDVSQDLLLLPYSSLQHDFIKKNFRYLPLVIELHVISGKTERKRIYLQNESPIASNFSVSIKNFLNRTALEDDDDESEMDELSSGIILFVEPMKGEIKPNELIFFDIIALSNTWGEYTDRVLINIDLLPPYTFWIRIINNDSPISFPMYRNCPATIPKIRFNIFKSGPLSGKRKILIQNTSVIPLYLHWHCFSIYEDAETKPFNIILDLFSPFINVHQYLSTNKNFLEEVKKFFSCALNPAKSKEGETVDNKSNDAENSNTSSSGIDYIGNIATEGNDAQSNKNKNASKCRSSLKNSSCESSDASTTTDLSNATFNKMRDTDVRLSLTPYYGELINDLFVITPKELFLPPKEKRYVHIWLDIERLKTQTEKVKLYKACGFIRIPPIFKFNDNMYLRKDGYYLPPTEVYLECEGKEPTFLVESCKFQRTFEFHTKDFLQYKTMKLEVNKKLLFSNVTEENAAVDFGISEPFQIKSVSTQREIFYDRSAFVYPGDNVEVELKCKIDEKWIEDEIKRIDDKNKVHKCIVVNKTLSISDKEQFAQSVTVYIKVRFPSLKISTNFLNFGEICIGDSRSLKLDVQNLSDRPQYYEIKSRNENNIFSFYPKKALLTTRAVTVANLSQIAVRFSSKSPGIFKEVIEIISEIDGLVFNCTLEGIVY